MKNIVGLFLFSLICYISIAQAPGRVIRIKVVSDTEQPVAGATVQLLKTDSSIVKVQVSDMEGLSQFEDLTENNYLVQVSHTGFQPTAFEVKDLQHNKEFIHTAQLQPASSVLNNVTVTAKKPFVQFAPDKTIVNVDAGITNAGTTVMDVLEKSPGITVGRDGTIGMKGKPQVLILIDGKPTQLSGTDLQTFLSGISASQIDVIELIDNPGAKYDAAGNTGIINIKTKKLRQKGFNGSLSLALGQGIYNKKNNSLNLNYRTGKINLFLNYGNNLSRETMNMYALRKYFDEDGKDSLLLQQPNVTRTRIRAHNIKTGMDFFASTNTTLGIAFTGSFVNRFTTSYSTIDWMSPGYTIDSTIITSGTRFSEFQRAGVNINGHHTFPNKDVLTADVDLIGFEIKGGQFFETQLDVPGSIISGIRGNIPSTLDIFTAKLDYSKRFQQYVWEAGLKTAHTKTNNLAEYFSYDGQNWYDDLSRSNHFLYDERISSAYSSLGFDSKKWQFQGGLRYEHTGYKANQLGNAIVKDSAFRRDYGNLFPTAFITYHADSSNNFTFRFGRRIDRPQFQNLNPFIITINKYTFEGGNPYINPQFTWNFEIVHTYKQLISTSISYSYLKDYFSQLFIIDSNSSNVNKNVIIYTRGNVGNFQSIGATMTLQWPLTKWWNLTGVAVYTHKIIKGFIWKPIEARIHQVNINLNNQFQFKNGWAAEMTGWYQSNSQIDLQEIVTPRGEMGFGISRQIMKGKGTLRLTFRDIFYTQNYSGYSNFENSDEPFEVKWDSRVIRLAFNWRFGKAMKAVRRSSGSAAEETERVGTGN